MKYALITGANGGLAHNIITAIKDDFFLILTDINEAITETYKDLPQKLIVVGDLTKKETLNSLFDQIKNITKTLDLVMHFAGILEIGPLMEVKVEAFENLMQVNLFAVYSVNQKAFPFLKKSKGRIIHLSSEYGALLALPFHSFYTISKRSIEVYNDSLRRELKSFGIKVIKIRPGAFKTEMQANVTSKFEKILLYTKDFKRPLTKMQRMMLTELERAKDPRKITKTFKKAIYDKRPKITYKVNNSFKMKVLNAMPVKVQDYLLGLFFN
ncbi:MAG: Cyclopentanol dehydrogenase [Tenericutes bacterium ADurb.Bin087]|nr:MAG: Cyclopentanol dehydrogenase [Tenericutes bacterium ADurb.Bin087]